MRGCASFAGRLLAILKILVDMKKDSSILQPFELPAIVIILTAH